jgi:2-oxoglutarate ferredoxin oxidoreductase subunit gamma
MARLEVRIVGFGGQGIILCGYILGKAASLYDGNYATLTQAYGPEARGGACRAEVVISDETVDYPRVIRPNILAIMSQEGFSKFGRDLADGGHLLIENELVDPEGLPESIHPRGIPATRIAETQGRRIMANLVMLGFLTGTTEVVSVAAMETAVANSVPRGTEALNLQAFRKGLEYALEGKPA